MTDQRQTRNQERADVPESVRLAYRKLGPENPPDMLDQAVLNHARRAVEHRAAGRPWSFGWPHTATTAAVVVLSVTLILQFRGEESGDIRGPAAPAPGAEMMDADPAAVRRQALEPELDDAESNARPAEGETGAPPEAAGRDPVLRESQESRAVAPFTASETVQKRAAEELAATPQASLEAIRALVADGELERARATLAEFRTTWPDHPVPDDLVQALSPP